MFYSSHHQWGGPQKSGEHSRVACRGSNPTPGVSKCALSWRTAPASGWIMWWFLIWAHRKCTTCPVVSGHYQSLRSFEEEGNVTTRRWWVRKVILFPFHPLGVLPSGFSSCCSFSDWRKEQFERGKWFFIYLFDPLLTCPLRSPLRPCLSFLTSSPSWKDRHYCSGKEKEDMKSIQC